MLKKSLIVIGGFIVVALILTLVSCQGKLVYNLGTKNDTAQNIRDVDVTMLPEGFAGGGILTPKQEKWVMYITKWRVPEKIKVSLEDSFEKKHELEIKTNLDKNFRGDILVIIKEKDGKFYLELKTGKLDELS